MISSIQNVYMALRTNLFQIIHLHVLLFVLHVTAQEQYPSVSCPDIFKYSFDSNFGGQFGLIDVQRDGSPTSVLQVNMTMNTRTPVSNNIKIEVLSKQNDILYGDRIRYAVRFPSQDFIPKLTQIQFNERILCSAEAEPLRSGVIQTSMWAKSTLTTYREPVHNQPSTTFRPVEDPNPSFHFFIGAPPSSINSAANSFGLVNPFLPSPTTKKVEEPVTRAPQPTTTRTTTTTVSPVPVTNAVMGSVNNKRIQCGVTSSTQTLIIGGEEIAPGDFPWLAAIMYRQNSDYKLHCTGNLISDRHILTAGHCVRYHNAPLFSTDDLIVILGKLNTVNWATGGVARNVKLVESHPNYKQDTADYDIALILLNEPVNFRPTVRPICLWEGNEDLSEIVGQSGTVVGWYKEDGAEVSSIAQKVEMPVVSQETCLRSNKVFKKYTSSRTFCAGNIETATGPCTGDSGAGFTMKDTTTNTWYLRGLVGFSIKDPQTSSCDLNHYVIFIDVAKILSWVKEKMNSN